MAVHFAIFELKRIIGRKIPPRVLLLSHVSTMLRDTDILSVHLFFCQSCSGILTLWFVLCVAFVALRSDNRDWHWVAIAKDVTFWVGLGREYALLPV